MARRFYEVEFGDRPAFFEDIGGLLRIAGLIFQGDDRTVILHLPGSQVIGYGTAEIEPTPEEWSLILQHSDDPKFYDEIGKAWHRKVRYAISGAIQQKVWVRDGLACAFCAQPIGKVALTVDHWIPLELGGANDPTNYITACRACNKRKGKKHPRDFCLEEGHDFDILAGMMWYPLK